MHEIRIRLNAVKTHGFFAIVLLFSIEGSACLAGELPTGRSLGHWLEYYRDQRPPEAWSTVPTDKPFQAGQESILGFGFIDYPIWTRVRLAPMKQRLQYLEVAVPYLDEVDVMFQESNGIWRHIKTGRKFPFSERPFMHRFFVFPLTILEPTTIYMRVLSDEDTTLNVRLWSSEEFLIHETKQNILLGIYYGIVVSLSIYNLFLFFAIRDLTYLYYVISIVTLHGFTQLHLNGLDYQYLWPSFPKFNRHCINAFMIASALSALLTVRSYVQSAIYAPRWHSWGRYYLGFLLLLSAMPLFASFQTSNMWIAIFGVGTLVSAIGTGIAAWKGGSPWARAYIVAWTPFALTIAATLIGSMGFLDNSHPILESGMQFGGAVEVLLLSFGLADRINQLRRDVAEAEKQTQLEQTTVARLQAVALEKKLLDSEMKAAQAVQNTLLAGDLDNPKYQIKTFYHPAGLTGGDWYGYRDLPQDNLLFAFIGDVTGHGVASSLITGVVTGVIHTCLDIGIFRKLSPDALLIDLLHSVNQAVLKAGKENHQAMTMCFVACDFTQNLFWIINAGHCFPLLRLSSGEIKPIVFGGNVLGLHGNPDFKLRTYPFCPGDLLFFYTDGLIENGRAEQKNLNTRSVRRILTDKRTPDDILTTLRKGPITSWGNNLEDDTTIMIVDRKM